MEWNENRMRERGGKKTTVKVEVIERNKNVTLMEWSNCIMGKLAVKDVNTNNEWCAYLGKYKVKNMPTNKCFFSVH